LNNRTDGKDERNQDGPAGHEVDGRLREALAEEPVDGEPRRREKGNEPDGIEKIHLLVGAVYDMSMTAQRRALLERPYRFTIS
jgi:hypothetical protein